MVNTLEKQDLEEKEDCKPSDKTRQIACDYKYLASNLGTEPALELISLLYS